MGTGVDWFQNRLRAAISNYLTETSAHGLSRLTGDRRQLYVKLVWLAAFLVSVVFCTMRISDAYKRFAAREVATTIRANALEFIFPDVYMCNEKPISGSYSVRLSDIDSHLLNRYRSLVWDSLADKMALMDATAHLENYALRLANTLPKQFLYERLANQKNQAVLFYYFFGVDVSRVATFRHPLYLNCLRLNLSEAELAALQKPSNAMALVLLLDPQLPPPFDNSTENDVHILTNNQSINVKPIDLNLDYGLDMTTPVGWQLYLVPRGHYPSELDTQLSLAPGKKHRLKISMQDIVYNPTDFDNSCPGHISGDSVMIVNPYTGEKQTFSGSKAICWYREIARLSKEYFNCSVWRIPLTWEYDTLPSCYNISEHGSEFLLVDDVYILRTGILDKAREKCEVYKQCSSRIYSYAVSSSTWPVERDWFATVKPYLFKKSFTIDAEPGLHYLMYNGTFSDARDSLVQIELSALTRMSDEVQMSLAYSFNSLIADIGGLLGLFLGMSMLSAVELLELLHDFCLAAISTRCCSCCSPDKIQAADVEPQIVEEVTM